MEENKTLTSQQEAQDAVEAKVVDVKEKAEALKEDVRRDFNEAEAKAKIDAEAAQKRFEAAKALAIADANEAEAKAKADWKHAASEAEEKFDQYSRQAGARLGHYASVLDAQAKENDDEFDDQFNDFASEARDRMGDLRERAVSQVSDFANEMQTDPKQAFLDAAKAGLMIIGLIALIKGLFRR